MDENRVEGAARNVGGKFQEAVGNLTGDADTQIRGKVNQAAGRVQNAAGGLVDEMHDLSEMTAQAVRDQPLAMLGLAAASGVLLGLLMRR